jgi:hypothetical protein
LTICRYCHPALWLLSCGWSSSTTVLWHKSIHFDHGVIDASPPIGYRRGWGLWVPSAFERFKHLETGLGLIFGNSTRYS